MRYVVFANCKIEKNPEQCPWRDENTKKGVSIMVKNILVHENKKKAPLIQLNDSSVSWSVGQ